MATLPLFYGGTHQQFFDFVLGSVDISAFFEKQLDPALARISR